MPYLVIRHTVEDYARWKPLFDQHCVTRQNNGCRGGQLFRNANSPNELVILFEWDNLEKARQFSQSSDLREIMRRAGVIGQPDIYFLEKIEDVPM
jgi:quinol monooxygenase YgiN